MRSRRPVLFGNSLVETVFINKQSAEGVIPSAVIYLGFKPGAVYRQVQGNLESRKQAGKESGMLLQASSTDYVYEVTHVS